jgi:hypothetical protein
MASPATTAIRRFLDIFQHQSCTGNPGHGLSFATPALNTDRIGTAASRQHALFDPGFRSFDPRGSIGATRVARLAVRRSKRPNPLLLRVDSAARWWRPGSASNRDSKRLFAPVDTRLEPTASRRHHRRSDGGRRRGRDLDLYGGHPAARCPRVGCGAHASRECAGYSAQVLAMLDQAARVAGSASMYRSVLVTSSSRSPKRWR